MSHEYDSTADMLERLAQETFRRTVGHPAPAMVMRRLAEEAAPEFDRIWAAGHRPSLRLDSGPGGRLVLEVGDDGPSASRPPASGD